MKFEVFVECDEEGTGDWSAMPDLSNHFDVLVPAAVIQAINMDPLMTTNAKNASQSMSAIVSADVRLQSLMNADLSGTQRHQLDATPHRATGRVDTVGAAMWACLRSFNSIWEASTMPPPEAGGFQMAIKGQPFNAAVTVWDTNLDTGKNGDIGNITWRLLKDGVDSAAIA